MGIYENGKYVTLNPTWHVEDSPWKARKVHEAIVKHGLTPKTICEVGCGAGEILAQLQKKMPTDCRFTGYEISPQAYELCKSRANPALSFELKDVLEEDVCFDLMLAIDVVEHVEDYFGFLRRLRDKGRYKMFHFPLGASALAVIRGNPAKGWRGLGHLHLFTRETVLYSLQHCGYQIMDAYYTPGGVELPPKSYRQILAKLPRRMLFGVTPHLAVRLLGGYSLLVLAV